MVDKNYTDCPSSRENFKRKNLIWSKWEGTVMVTITVVL